MVGEGNGNPLQCSCLENPRDGKPGGLPSMGLHRVGHDWSDLVVVVVKLWAVSFPMLTIQLTHEQCRVLVTEVGDRWALGLDSWCLSSGVKVKLCSHPDTARTKLVAGAELWSKEIRWPLLRSKKTSLCTRVGKLLGGQKGKGSIP